MTWPQYLNGLCRLDGKTVRLTRREADVLLSLLLGHPERPKTDAEIVEDVWPNAYKQPLSARHIVGVYVYKLRERGITIRNRHTFGNHIPRDSRALPDLVQ